MARPLAATPHTSCVATHSAFSSCFCFSAALCFSPIFLSTWSAARHRRCRSGLIACCSTPVGWQLAAKTLHFHHSSASLLPVVGHTKHKSPHTTRCDPPKPIMLEWSHTSHLIVSHVLQTLCILILCLLHCCLLMCINHAHNPSSTHKHIPTCSLAGTHGACMTCYLPQPARHMCVEHPCFTSPTGH